MWAPESVRWGSPAIGFCDDVDVVSRRVTSGCVRVADDNQDQANLGRSIRCLHDAPDDDLGTVSAVSTGHFRVPWVDRAHGKRSRRFFQRWGVDDAKVDRVRLRRVGADLQRLGTWSWGCSRVTVTAARHGIGDRSLPNVGFRSRTVPDNGPLRAGTPTFAIREHHVVTALGRTAEAAAAKGATAEISVGGRVCQTPRHQS